MDDEKIIQGKATVRPHPYLKKAMGHDTKEPKKQMNVWEFLDKQCGRLYGFVMSPCGIIALFAILGAICSLFGVKF